MLAAKFGKTEDTTVGPTMVTKPWSPEKGQPWPDGLTLAADRDSHLEMFLLIYEFVILLQSTAFEENVKKQEN